MPQKGGWHRAALSRQPQDPMPVRERAEATTGSETEARSKTGCEDPVHIWEAVGSSPGLGILGGG